MYILDTSIYVSAFLEDDENNQKALEIFNKLDGQINLPYLVFQETVTVLTYKHSLELAKDFSNFILEDKRFIISNGETIEEIFFWKKINKRLSFIDITVIYNALKYNALLYTFDIKMLKLYNKLK